MLYSIQWRTTPKFKIKILEVSLKVHPDVSLAYAKALEHGTATYLHSQVQSRFLKKIWPLNRKVCSWEIYLKGWWLGSWKLMELIFIILISPHSDCWWWADDAHNIYWQSFYSIIPVLILSGLNSLFDDKGNFITRKDYAKEYTLFAYD